jgi:hypothetical protein
VPNLNPKKIPREWLGDPKMMKYLTCKHKWSGLRGPKSRQYRVCLLKCGHYKDEKGAPYP